MKMIVLRGLSGSAKSTTAAELAAQAAASNQTCVICSADDFMMVDGKYVWKAEKLFWAHKSCQEKARQACVDKVDLVIIDNTNLDSKSRRQYWKIAEEFGYETELKMVGDFSEEFALICAGRNQHGVSADHIVKLARRFRGTEGVVK